MQLIPFNSSRKRACTAIKHPDDNKLVRVFCKGGPEVVFKYVSKMYDKEGNIVRVDE